MPGDKGSNKGVSNIASYDTSPECFNRLHAMLVFSLALAIKHHTNHICLVPKPGSKP